MNLVRLFLIIALSICGCSKQNGNNAIKPEATPDVVAPKTARKINESLHQIEGLQNEINEIARTPNSFGCYAIDNNHLVRLRKYDFVFHTVLSETTFFILYFKNKPDLNFLFIYDLEFLGFEDPPKIKCITKLIPGHSDMIMIIPPAPLKKGLYEVDLSRYEEFMFSVQVTDIESYWQSVLAKHSNSWQAHNYLGSHLFMDKKFKEATSHFFEAARLNPKDATLFNNLGLGYSNQGWFDAAILEYRKAIEILPNEPSIHTNLGNALGQLKRYDEAISEFREAIRLYSNDPVSRCNLGYVLMKQGKVDEAIEELQKALQIDPLLAQAKLNLDTAMQMKNEKK